MMLQLHIQSDSGGKLFFEFENFSSAWDKINSHNRFRESLVANVTTYYDNKKIGSFGRFEVIDFLQALHYMVYSLINGDVQSVVDYPEHDMEFCFTNLGNCISIAIHGAGDEIFCSKFQTRSVVSFIVQLSSLATLKLSSFYGPEVTSRSFEHFFEDYAEEVAQDKAKRHSGPSRG